MTFEEFGKLIDRMVGKLKPLGSVDLRITITERDEIETGAFVGNKLQPNRVLMRAMFLYLASVAGDMKRNGVSTDRSRRMADAVQAVGDVLADFEADEILRSN